ncbi:hypothetical protein TDIS_0629 [Thermosulfurimonas dismutans]|uniref:Uncharacterized protein n=1 Tax=Thermosulfurimonas dismutans TaxID=999894 RepID=A0A179D725_9BACT|nr:hypothetical protein TDIS_0629 [Thermosulfurimonas dismutans]
MDWAPFLRKSSIQASFNEGRPIIIFFVGTVKKPLKAS